MKFIEQEEAYKAIRDFFPNYKDRKKIRDALDNVPSVDPVAVLRKTSTQCWTCDNACGGCDWADNFKPIEGWVAVRNDISVGLGGYVESYIVLDCPNYEREVRDGNSRSEELEDYTV